MFRPTVNKFDKELQYTVNHSVRARNDKCIMQPSQFSNKPTNTGIISLCLILTIKSFELIVITMIANLIDRQRHVCPCTAKVSSSQTQL